jgi:hypothetical protein
METQELERAACAYVARWFWPLEQLSAAVGLGQDDVARLIAAGCAPGPVYARSAEGWWSALAAARGDAPSQPPREAACWYSPSAAWHLRRALLHMRRGADPHAAAEANRRHFVAGFVDLAPSVSHARLAFPGCWEGERFLPDAARQAAEREWGFWLNGAYGVCLRVFNADTCVRKEALAAKLRGGLANGEAHELLDDAQALAALLLPFAPWERDSGTPGLIDRLLSAKGLGRELPYEWPEPSQARTGLALEAPA